ncbi:MAG: ArsA family ATPase [Chloroflexi bacterium]|nr:ArsA family ATPase [Chloroflexota bacterium]
MRILIYSGKGGVGKTTVAAATAVRCADMGLRTIVLSTDAAHSLGDCLGVALESEPIQVADNLWAEEVNPLHEMEQNWKIIQSFLSEVLAWQGADEITSEELAVIPGSEELFSLIKLKGHHDEGRYDVIIVDAAPTGETLRLLGLPDVMRWWMNRIFPTVRNLMKYVRPVVQRVTTLPVASDEVFASVESMIDRLNEVRDLISNPEISSVRIVLNYEKMVVKEAQRNLTYLNLFGYNVDCVVANRIMGIGQNGPWRETQRQYGDVVRDSFAPLPILEVPLFDREVLGLEPLRDLAGALFGDRSPETVFYRGKTQQITKQQDHMVLTLPLPFNENYEVNLTQHGDELALQVGWYKRSIMLPSSLARLTATDARVGKGQIDITFEEPAAV